VTEAHRATAFALPERDVEAFVDADWIAAAGPGTPAFLRYAGRRLGGDWTATQLEAEPDQVEALAAAVLLAVAEEAAASVVERVPAGTARVLGTGLVAQRVRSRLGSAEDGRPAAMVDAVGSAESFAAAVAAVVDGGLVVLAGAPAAVVAQVDLYADVHVRGLRVVGVSLPLDHADITPAAADVAPTIVSSGQPLPAAAWYRIRAE
jgi:hypothetical protein